MRILTKREDGKFSVNKSAIIERLRARMKNRILPDTDAGVCTVSETEIVQETFSTKGYRADDFIDPDPEEFSEIHEHD